MESAQETFGSKSGQGIMRIPFELYGNSLYIPPGCVQLIRAGKPPLLLKSKNSTNGNWLYISRGTNTVVYLKVYNTDSDSSESSPSVSDSCCFEVVLGGDSPASVPENGVVLALYKWNSGRGWMQFHNLGTIYIVNPGSSAPEEEDKRPWKISSHSVDDKSKHTFVFENCFYQIGDILYTQLFSITFTLNGADLGSTGGWLYATVSSDDLKAVDVHFSSDSAVPRSDDYFPIPLYEIDKDGNVLVDVRFCGVVMMA